LALRSFECGTRTNLSRTMTTLPPQPMCMPWGKELYATLRSGRPPASLRPMLPHRFIHHLPGRQQAETFRDVDRTLWAASSVERAASANAPRPPPEDSGVACRPARHSTGGRDRQATVYRRKARRWRIALVEKIASWQGKRARSDTGGRSDLVSSSGCTDVISPIGIGREPARGNAG